MNIILKMADNMNINVYESESVEPTIEQQGKQYKKGFKQNAADPCVYEGCVFLRISKLICQMLRCYVSANVRT